MYIYIHVYIYIEVSVVMEVPKNRCFVMVLLKWMMTGGTPMDWQPPYSLAPMNRTPIIQKSIEMGEDQPKTGFMW